MSFVNDVIPIFMSNPRDIPEPPRALLTIDLTIEELMIQRVADTYYRV